MKLVLTCRAMFFFFCAMRMNLVHYEMAIFLFMSTNFNQEALIGS